MLWPQGTVVIGSTIGPYRVLGRIGAGGMGEVYRAQDTRLGRDVALKVLSADLQSPDTRERLLHEARAAATLNHPNVGSIYDVLESDGRLCLVMEFVEGETLNARLARGRLRCEELLPIVRQLLDGLAHAHEHGIVHRDLKPANLVLTPDGRLKILDFGIARIRAARTRPAHRDAMRESPEIVGSPGYAAPEHLRGDAIGPRADLYSVGVVMFQCLAGQLPFNAPDLITSLVAPLTDKPPDFSKLCPAATDDVIAIMQRALRSDPAERFESAEDMRRAVERALAAQADRPTAMVDAGSTRRGRRSRGRWAAAALVVALAGTAAVPLYRRWTAAAVPVGRPVLAVLPLENLSGDPSKAWLGAGVAETLGVSLSKLKSVTVISRSDVVEATRRTQDSASIARQVGATLLVAGSIQEWQNRLRATVRLVNPDGRVVWSDVYEAPVDAIFALQAEIAAALSNHLQVTVSSNEGEKFSQQLTTSREALTEYWKGQAALERVTLVANVQSAIDSFTRAITLDPNFALAHAALANAYWIQYGETHDKELTAQATSEAMKALTLDPDQPRVRISLGVIYTGTGQYQSAEIELRRAVALDPASDEAYRQLATVLLQQNRSDEGIRAHNQAISIRPDYWRNHYALGIAYLRLGRPEEAKSAFQRAIDLQPDNAGSHSNMGIVYGQLGDTSRALAEFERANALAPSRRGYTNLGMQYSEAGRLEDALKAYRFALTFDAQSEVTHGNIGDVLVRLGRIDEARREYETARALGLKLLQVNDKDAGALARVAAFEAKLGMRDAALEHGKTAVALSPRNPEVNYKMAVVQATLQQTDAALRTLARALEYGYSPSLARSDYDLAPLRSRPEFQKLLAPATQSAGEHR